MLAITPRYNHKNSRWTAEKEHLLRTLWAQGLSCSMIAGELGDGLTRNAVISKARRLGLDGRREGVPTAETRMLRRRQTAARYFQKRGKAKQWERRALQTCTVIVERSLPPPCVDDIQIPLEQRKTLIELTRKTCRWPVGDPQSEDFFFCGAEPIDKSPYCWNHFCRAHRQDAA